MNFKNIISGFSLIAIMLSAAPIFAEPIVALSENKTDYEQTADGYVLHFSLEATADELAAIQANIAPLADRVKLEVELVSTGHYKCTYTITHQNQPEYVHKMMFASGFNTIIHKGQTLELSKVIDILYEYQEAK